MNGDEPTRDELAAQLEQERSANAELVAENERLATRLRDSIDAGRGAKVKAGDVAAPAVDEGPTCTACGLPKSAHVAGAVFHAFTLDADADGAADPKGSATVVS